MGLFLYFKKGIFRNLTYLNFPILEERYIQNPCVTELFSGFQKWSFVDLYFRK